MRHPLKKNILATSKHWPGDDNYRKIIMLNCIAVLAIVNLLVFGGAVFKENFTLGLLDLSVAGVVLFFLVYFNKTGNYYLAAHCVISIFVPFFLYLLASGGIDNSAFMWLYTFPLFSFFLLGHKQGLPVNFILYTLSAGFLLLDGHFVFFTDYDASLKIRFLASYGLVLLLSYLYENLRSKTQHELEALNCRLDDLVVEKTKELQKANTELIREIYKKERSEIDAQQSHNRLLSVLNSINVVVYVADMQSYEVLLMNHHAETIFGNGTGKRCWEVFQENQDGPCAFCPNSKLMISEEDFTGTYCWELHNKKDKRWYDVRDCGLRWHDERLVRISIATDITERKHFEHSLLQAKKEWEQTFDAVADPIMIVDPDFNIIKANRAMAAFMRLSPDDCLGKKCYHLLHKQDMPINDCPNVRLFKDGKGHRAEIADLASGKNLLVSVSPLFDEQGKLLNSIHVCHDMTEHVKIEKMLRESEANLRKLSLTDELTGLLNRRGFLTLARKQLEISDRMDDGICLLYADLDNLKYINDTFGHDKGDDALRKTAEILKKTFRQSDIIGRLGGDEFAIFMREKDEEEECTTAFLARLKKRLQFFNEDNPDGFTLSLSTGTAKYISLAPCTVEELISRADKAMYRCKKRKKNRA